MQSLFILELTYKKDLSEVERYLTEHNHYLEKYYAQGHFICSGRKNPRTGGIILARGESRQQLEKIIQDDPFWQQQIADYQITEFIPSKADPDFRFA